MSKIIKVIAGPNGSGKTTFAESFVFQTKPMIPFLNPDLIAMGFGPIEFEKASFQAGRVLLAEIKTKIQNGESFAFESTLSGLTYAKILKNAKEQGFKITIYFVGLTKVSLNILRIKNRVKQGGHDIPSKTVRRRYLRCFDNFWNLYREISDDWYILDNSMNKPTLVQEKELFYVLPEKQKNLFVKRFLKGHL